MSGTHPNKHAHLYNIYTMFDQRRRRWVGLHKWYTNILCLLGWVTNILKCRGLKLKKYIYINP